MNIVWKRIFIIGFVIEFLAILFLSFINPALLQLPLTHESVSIGLLLAAMVAGICVNLNAQKNQLINGALVGCFTVIVYVAITVSAELAGLYQVDYDFEYFVKHFAKIIGGAIGGLLVVGFSTKAWLGNKAA